MDAFELNKQFDNFESLLAAKKQYESASNTILVIDGSHKLKGEGDFVTSQVYDRVSYVCKAGKERPMSSKNIRKSSTYKAGCPFKVNIALVNLKLTVQFINPNHENHQLDRKTYLSYPESVRLTEKEIEDAKRMIDCGASKQQLKAVLSKNREAPVPLKLLHNLHTKQRLEKQTINRKDDFKRMIDMMLSVTNARVRIIENVEKELVGVFFQDERMAHVFQKYPEILFYDGTHKLNKLDLPLFILLSVDGNGDSEIVCLFICVSESRECIGSMIDEFKKLNAEWIRTKVILGDKDFAYRSVFLEKFLNAVLKICIFHVLRTFRREITTHKRGITNGQREQTLKILERLLYSTSEEVYCSTYNELVNLNLEHVTQYYNNNWHCIRNEWTLFGINRDSSYLNTTNNRSESLNQKLKMVGNRNANLQTFFENLTISVYNQSSEKDLAAIRGSMRRSRQGFDDPVLSSYKGFLTQFTFEKVEKQYALAAHVEFLSINDEEAIVKNARSDKVSTTMCSCLFFSSMNLPCRHVLKFLMAIDLDPFTPELCATRWTQAYFRSSHPALSSQAEISKTTPTYVKVRDSTEIDQIKKSFAIVKDIRNVAAKLSPAERSSFVNKLKDCTDDFLNSCRDTNSALDDSVETMAEPPQHTNTDNIEMPLDLCVRNPIDNSTISSVELYETHNKENVPITTSQHVAPSTTNIRDEPSIFKQSQPFAVLSSIENIKVPDKVNSVGRPKDITKKAIGLKRKNTLNASKSAKKICEDSIPQVRFVEKTEENQVLTIIQWLTQRQLNEVPKELFSSKDIVTDTNVLNRLRNEEVLLDSLQKYVDYDCLQLIKNKVDLLQGKPWICSKCGLCLEGYQVRCDYCLDWFHFQCVCCEDDDAFTCSSCI